MACTGIEYRQNELELFLREIWPEPEKTDNQKPTFPLEPLDLDDEELLKRAREAVNGGKFSRLWAGNWQADFGDKSQSEADLALCGLLAFWTRRDKERMDRLFRRSGLYRDKWDRDDYRNGTMDKAIVECREVYTPSGPKSEPGNGGPSPIEWEPGYSIEPPPQNTHENYGRKETNPLRLPPMPEVITAAALQKKQFRNPEFIVKDIIPEGTTLFTGKAKVGKSFAMADIALACSCGGRAFGKIAVPKFGVLYLCLEDQERRIQKRIGVLCLRESWPENLHLSTTWPRIDQRGIPLLQEWLEHHRDVKLVIVDTLAKIKSRKRTTQTLYDIDYQCIEAVKSLADMMDISIIIVHHLRKMAADDDPFDCISGSTGLTGAVDTAIILRRDRTGKGLLYVRGRDIEEQELALDRDSSGGWTLLGNAETVIHSEEQALILSLMDDGEPISITQICQVTGKSKQNVYNSLSRLAQKGAVKKTKVGRYFKYIKTTI